MKFNVKIAVMDKKNNTVAKVLKSKELAPNAQEALAQSLTNHYNQGKMTGDDLYQVNVAII
jgi:hypothetical protein